MKDRNININVIFVNYTSNLKNINNILLSVFNTKKIIQIQMKTLINKIIKSFLMRINNCVNNVEK